MSIYDGIEMGGLSAEEQSKRAILHTLKRIRDHEIVGYYLGFGGEAFALLTEAYASLTGQPVADVRRAYQCRDPKRAEVVEE